MKRAAGSIGDMWRDQGCLGQALLILLLSVLVGVPCGVLSIVVYPPAPLPTATQPAPLTAAGTANARPAPAAAPASTALSVGVSAASSREAAQVIRVLAGDSIEVSIGSQVFQVRYMGIEAPDVFGWAGQQAMAFNERLVAGKTVYLEGGDSDTDRFQRLLRYVYVEDLFVNAELLRMGHARVATHPPEVKHQELFAGLERKARATGRGLWAHAFADGDTRVFADGDTYAFADGNVKASGNRHHDGSIRAARASITDGGECGHQLRVLRR